MGALLDFAAWTLHERVVVMGRSTSHAEGAMTTIVLTEAVDQAGIDVLAARTEFRLVVAAPGTAAFEAALPDAVAIGVRVARLDQALLSRAAKLRVAAKHGVGFDNIDVAYLAGRGIPVTVTADANSISVAEHTMTLMLAAAKHLRAYDGAVRGGDWEFRKSARAVELAGRRVLVVGFGRIGRRVAALCRAFGLHVLVHDSAAAAREQAAAAGYACVAELEAGLAQADVLTLHIPLTPHSAMLIDAARLSRLPRGAIVVNCARGGILDEDALAQALARGGVGAAALDVFGQEPIVAAHPLAAFDNVVLTPHSAATTREGARAMAVAMARNILGGIDGRLDPSCIVDPASAA